MPVEIEVKLRAESAEPMTRLARLPTLGPASLGPPRLVDERDRYLDTPDGRLAAARWACRLRTREGTTRVSLKGPAEGATADGMHRRPELEGPAIDELRPEAWPASEARAFLERLIDGAALTERFELVQQRTERPVLVGDRRIATLSLDDVEVRAEGRSHGRFLAVELELAPDARAADEALLDEIGTALHRMDGLLPEGRSKLERALELVWS